MAEEVKGYTSVYPTADGFGFDPASNGQLSDGTYIYMAIRAPMMVEPEAGTDVFAVSTSVSTNPDWVSGFAPDMGIYRYTLGTNNFLTSARLTQGKYLRTNDASSEYTDSNASSFDYSNGFGSNVGTSQPSDSIGLLFKRAKGFFDVVCYTGNYTGGHSIKHSLGVAPEMIWVKCRDTGYGTAVMPPYPLFGNDGYKNYGFLHQDAYFTTGSYWNDTAPTDTDFKLSQNGIVNGNGLTYIAYLFASVPGVSKCGGFIGNGSSQNIDCGFSNGARFVLIKAMNKYDGAPWYIWDTERGIVAGDDPHLNLNDTFAEVTTDDSIDPYSAGFAINQTSTDINLSGKTYLFLAIA
jgi:hypothetical protein